MSPAVRRPVLVLGLGGSLAGDDAIGLVLARALAREPRLPSAVEVQEGGADLLRCAPELVARRRVVLLDAVEAEKDETEPLVGDHPLPGLDARPQHAHPLSAVQARALLRLLEPELARVRFTWFLVPVRSAGPAPALSPDLAARLPELISAALAIL